MDFIWPSGSPASSEVRKAFRQAILEMIYLAESGHPGGSLSLVEILSAIFDGNFQQDKDDPENLERDRIVLSKGHGVPALYAMYSFLGYFPPHELKHLRTSGHFLQGHPDRLRYSLMEASTGSLGQGVSVALGLALGLRLKFSRGEIKRLPRVYCVLGDGEAQEGQVWECLMSCGKFMPGNLIFILDANKGQIDGPVSEVMNLEPIVDKVKAFNLAVAEVDGHNVEILKQKLSEIKISPQAPVPFFVARTNKGQGVSLMQNKIDWHGKAPTREELTSCLEELYSGSTVSLPNGSLVEGIGG